MPYAFEREEPPYSLIRNSREFGIDPTDDMTSCGFRKAARIWLESRRMHLSPRTFEDYGNYIQTLGCFFGEMRLPEIDGDQVRAYQRARTLRAGAGAINKELGLIKMMRERIGMPLTDYQRLKEPKDYESPGRRLTKDEEERLERVFRAAADVPKWMVAAMASLISMKSGLGPGEIRSLRLKDCSLNPPQICVPPKGAKNQRRQRMVPLNDAAAWALEKLSARAQKCGSLHPDHYLIPFRHKERTFDVTRSCSDDGWRTAQRQLFNMADVKMRPYDFRHHAVSVAISDARVTREGAKAYFGWIPDRMFGRYGHQEVAALRVVAAAIGKDSIPSDSRADGEEIGNTDVTELVSAGLDADIVVEKIRVSNCKFDTSPATLKELNESGIPKSVIRAMVRAKSASGGETAYARGRSSRL